MSVLHDFECAAHGRFEARVQAGVIPQCPKGCSKAFVALIHTKVSIASERVKTSTRLVREMADAQGLLDIDVSPSTPGGSVAEKNYLKSRNPITAQAGSTWNVAGLSGQVDVAKLPHGANGLTNSGFGHPYNRTEWRTGKDGKTRHYGSPPLEPLPPLMYAGKPRSDR
jgi:hypothetical protein